MDPLRFDHLTRVLSEARGRRAVLGALLGTVLGNSAVAAAARKRDKGKQDRPNRPGPGPGAGPAPVRGSRQEEQEEKGQEKARQHQWRRSWRPWPDCQRDSDCPADLCELQPCTAAVCQGGSLRLRRGGGWSRSERAVRGRCLRALLRGGVLPGQRHRVQPRRALLRAELRGTAVRAGWLRRAGGRVGAACRGSGVMRTGSAPARPPARRRVVPMAAATTTGSATTATPAPPAARAAFPAPSAGPAPAV